MNAVTNINEAAEKQLMLSIKQKYSAAMQQALPGGCPITEPFLAALIANESGGDPAAKHPEAQVLLELAQVMAGQRAAYGSIGGNDLRAWLRANGTDIVVALLNLSTSWSLTQIMGYEAVAGSYPLSDIAGPDFARHCSLCVAMLVMFAREWRLTWDPFPAVSLFHCWNSGRPTGPTTDPEYAAKGLARMAIYEALP